MFRILKQFAKKACCRIALPVESVPLQRESDGERLSRIVDYCTGGRLAEAELELYQWQRKRRCPDAAVTLLAGLLAIRGCGEDALAVTHRRAEKSLDIAKLHLALLIEADLSQAATQAAHRLFRNLGSDRNTRSWLTAIQSPGSSSLPEISPARVEQLAAELLTRIDLIPSLVVGQKLEVDVESISLLRQAIGQLYRDIVDVDEQMIVCQAMTQLAELAQDDDEVRRWAHRGLKLNPYSAELALALSRIEDDPAVGPGATEVLRHAVDAHQDYPDLKAALIRREFAEGYNRSARIRLKRWLDEQPSHPIARKLEQEIAA